MAYITVPDKGLQFSTEQRVASFLEPFGIWYEHWDVEGRIDAEATAEAILSAYEPEIERLKQRGGFVTADVINVDNNTPGLDAMLEKFNKEHTHSEDEVRFIVKGRGIFHIHPVNAPVFAIEMEAGDLINVPAGTRHWFNLCADRTIRAIRLFQDQSGWTPVYMEDGVHVRYQPLCMGPKYMSADKQVEPVVKP